MRFHEEILAAMAPGENSAAMSRRDSSNPRLMGEVGREALRATWSGTLVSASSRDYGNLWLLLEFGVCSEILSELDFLNRARSAR
jgi:hypothetical protein